MIRKDALASQQSLSLSPCWPLLPSCATWNGRVLSVALLGCIDEPVRWSVDRFPIQRIACVEQNGRRWWWTAVDLFEEGCQFCLQAAATGFSIGRATLQLTDPHLVRSVELRRISADQLGVQFVGLKLDMEAALISLIQSCGVSIEISIT